MSTLLLAALLMQPAGTPAPDLAARFCRALTADDLREFAPLAADPHSLSTKLWRRVRNVVDNYDCVTVSSYRTWEDKGRTVVDVDATGITRNAAHQRRPIPHLWYLTPDSFEDEESELARRLIEAKSAEERQSIALDTPDALLGAAARVMSEDVPVSDPATLREPALFLLQWSQSHDKPETEAYALCILGRLAKGDSNDAAALRLFDAARDAARRTPSCDAVAYAGHQMIGVEKDPAKHAALIEEVAGSIESLDNPRVAFLAMHDRTTTECGSYDLAHCYATIDKIAALARRLGNREAEARAVFSRGRTATTVQDVDTSMRFLLQANRMARELMLPRLTALTYIGFYFVNANRLQPEKSFEAMQLAHASLQPEDEDLIAYTHSFLGDYLMNHDRVREADAHLEPALRLARRYPAYLANVLLLAFRVRAAQGRYEEAEAFAREAIEREKGSLDVVWALKSALGRVLVECGRSEEGIEELRQAIDLIEARRALSTSSAIVRAQYFKTRYYVYDWLLEELVATNRPEEAFAVSEQIKARGLADSMDAAGQQLPLTEPEQKQERELNQRIVDLNRSLMSAKGSDETELRHRLSNARADLEQFSIESFMRHSEMESPESSLVPAEAAAAWNGPVVIEYAVLEHSIVAFVIRGGKVAARRLAADRTRVERQAARLLSRIERRDLLFAHEARPLHDELIAPLADLLPRGGIVNIVPDGFLWKLPFDVLQTPAGTFLAEKYAIAYAPSLTMLERMRRHHETKQVKKELLALGDPLIGRATIRKAASFRGLSLGALPDAEREVRALSGLYGRDRSTILTGASARESALKKLIGQYRIVHLATHGIVDETSPLYSAIVLASAAGDSDDGLLEMREMRQLDLHAALVVLSGCDTARGDVFSGEGVIGMSWALFAAGCPTTVVSQWKAASHSTAELMIAFHSHLRAGESKAEALRHARLEVMRNPAWHHPMYWAPFILIGDGMSAVP